ncbi:MAG: arginine repressor [Syntrophomonadaceae bacterium]|nr:arginine repressor [Syntrophomonadaceae bacterium]
MKAQRHLTILDIIAGQRVSTQEELCELLKQRGFDVTQATVSRDIKELKLVKTADGFYYRYNMPESPVMKNSFQRMQRIFKELVLGCDYSENIIVIKTVAGGAQSVASVIDAYEHQFILGTVAGDDTIIAVVKPSTAVGEVMSLFTSLLNA